MTLKGKRADQQCNSEIDLIVWLCNTFTHWRTCCWVHPMEFSKEKAIEAEALSANTIFAKKKLGEGRSAVVYTKDFDGRTVCLKVFNSASEWNIMFKEANLLNKLAKVPGLPRVLCYCDSPIILVTTYDGPATLYSEIKEDPFLSRTQLLDIFLQITRTVEGLHKCGVAHNDLKENNVILRLEGDRYIATTIDLGNASALGKRPYRPFERGLYLHLPPEFSDGLSCSTKSDVYSLGTLMARIVKEVPSVRDDTELGHLIKAATLEDPEERISPCRLAEGLKDLIARVNYSNQKSDSEDQNPVVDEISSSPIPPRRGMKRPRSSCDECSFPLSKRPRLYLWIKNEESSD
ncbi:uncharacterized protein LOC143020160 [Oratosquilla oratoria]|uniref:uncharacterized protein LOC143020160 n=1 Tax=Oratosquilla oratoria TaxID=337810 RepID=UPI003F75807B